MFILISYGAVMSDNINYIYYEVLKTEKYFNEAEPTFELNCSVLIIITMLSFKLLCYSNSRILSSDNSQEGPYIIGNVLLSPKF